MNLRSGRSSCWSCGCGGGKPGLGRSPCSGRLDLFPVPASNLRMSRHLLALFLAIPALVAASDWPRFRGPNGSGISPDRGLPSELSLGHNVLWKAKTPKGHSSPIVDGGRVWITGFEGDQRML